ncbi:uncharacterized protein CBL_01200 [Carabus blaptoides fortunei]
MTFVLIVTLLAVIVESDQNNVKPHIVYIIADDLGWNDVGFHGSSQIPTPNIDALAYSGLILNRFYVTPICTPSRSALMTGKHPIHTGMQHRVLYGAEPRGLPLTETLLPEYLRDLGYTNRIVGKWHLGHYKKEYTPLCRGFDSHLGFWTGHHDYNDHTAVEAPSWGLDMRRGMETAWDLHGQYSTDVFTKEAVRLIHNHNASEPLFLYIAHAAVHSANPYNPLPAPDSEVAKFTNITNYNRRRFAGVLSKLDTSVGRVVSALKQNNMLENSIIIFSTDNGGAADGFNLNAASNWPLRGVKNTLWEGGVRGAGLIWSPKFQKRSRVSHQLMHISDWLPTLYYAAGGNPGKLGNIDGINIWEALSQDVASNRTEVLHNIDDIYGNSALTIGDWKVMKGTTYNGVWDSWYGPSGRGIMYDTNLVLNSLAGKALASINMAATESQMKLLREQADVKCSVPKDETIVPCKPLKAPCLFNVKEDPCEIRNLADKYPDLLRKLLDNIAKWNATAVPPGNLPLDPRGDPRFWDNTWTNFGDYSILSNAVGY